MYLYPHNENYAIEFEQEKQSIISAYPEEIDVFHIGSTSVKGLYAKNCIDLLGVVKDIAKVNSLKQSITGLGYVYKGENGIAGREYFSKNQRKVHLHIFQYDDANVEKHLKFNRIMQGNTALIDELNQLKQALHHKYPNNKDSYQKEKAPFYDRINKMP